MILDEAGRVFERRDLQIFTDDSAPILIFSNHKVTDLPSHVKVIDLPEFSIANILRVLYDEKIQSVYVEGGAAVHDAFLNSGLWDEIISYVTPKLIGGNGKAAISSFRLVEEVLELQDFSCQKIGNTIRLSAKRRT